MSDYTPEEQALKSQLDSLVTQIEPHPDFVAQLEQRLMQQELTQSVKPIRVDRRYRYSDVALIAAAIAGMVLFLGILLPLVFLASGDGDSSETESLVTNNQSTEIALADTPTVTDTPTPIPFENNNSPTLSAATQEWQVATGTMMAAIPGASMTPLPSQTFPPTPEATGTPGFVIPTIEQTPQDMEFQDYGVNPLIDAQETNLSTFSLDVDTGSYTVARSFLLDNGALPPPEAIRPEEFINYFPMGYTNPEENAFGLQIDAAPAPFADEEFYLMRVGVQGQEIAPEDRDPTLLIFVIDVSGSMDMDSRLGLVQQSLQLLVEELREEDRVGIVVYSDRSRVVLNPTPASEQDVILDAIHALVPEGSTNVEDGLVLGYQLAEDYMREGQNTRLIVLSDGVANRGETNPEAILENARDAANADITISTIGFGMDNYNDVLMEQLANNGDGNYYYVDTLNEAERVLVENLTSTLQVIAYDAKIQVVFNQDVVDAFRLIGYENREVADVEFRDDTVDAGEVGAGANVTALYELTLIDPEAIGEIATVFVRYEDAVTREVVELEETLTTADLLPSVEAAPATFRLAAVVAEFSELLRRSYWAQDNTYGELLDFAAPLSDDLAGDPDVAELLDLIERADFFSER